jgi:GT2 family glycosyltransferase
LDLPSVAVVILNWNGKNYLDRFLPFLCASTYTNLQIVVADNDSTDDSISFLQKEYPEVSIIKNKTNEGFAQGYNTALKQVEATYYVLLNSDVEVTQGFIEPIIELMEKDAKIGACQPKILDWNNKTHFEYAGASGGWIDSLGYPFCRGRFFENLEEDKGQYNNPEPIFWASGASLFVRSNIFHQLGGFDEYFFAHMEEIDLCWRIQLAGYKVFICPNSIVYHVGGGTLPKGNQRKVYLNFRNNLIMLYKNLPLSQLVWKLPLRFILDGISAWKNVFSGQLPYFKAVVQAHFAFIYWIFNHKKQKNNKSPGKIKLSGWYKGSIVWDHFIMGKKSFKEIIHQKM